MGRLAKLCVLLLVALTATAVIAVSANTQQQYFEDDDFGDFDSEGDMIEEVDSIPGPEDDDFNEGPEEFQGKETASVPVQKLVMAPVEEDEDAIVEVSFTGLN